MTEYIFRNLSGLTTSGTTTNDNTSVIIDAAGYSVMVFKYWKFELLHMML